MTKKIFNITGMHCESCKKLIESEFQDKVNRISVNEKTGRAEVDFNPGIISEKQIAETIKELGYGVK